MQYKNPHALTEKWLQIQLSHRSVLMEGKRSLIICRVDIERTLPIQIGDLEDARGQFCEALGVAIMPKMER